MRQRQQGFSLLEVMVVMAIFMVISGAVFQLMDVAQKQYRNEQQFLESFQGARLGVELIMRDVHNAGFPPPYTFAGNLAGPPTPPAYPAGVWTDPAAAPADLQRRFAIGVLGVRANAVNTACTVNGGATLCNLPNSWDLIIELDVDPENPNPDPITGLTPQVEWVRYDLRRGAGETTSTLYRTVRPKVAGNDPTRNSSVIPFVENVVQDPNLAVDAINIPVFTYDCDPDQILGLNAFGQGFCQAEHVKTVYINLRVQSERPTVGVSGSIRFRQITVQGAASRLNPTR